MDDSCGDVLHETQPSAHELELGDCLRIMWRDEPACDDVECKVRERTKRERSAYEGGRWDSAAIIGSDARNRHGDVSGEVLARRYAFKPRASLA